MDKPIITNNKMDILNYENDCNGYARPIIKVKKIHPNAKTPVYQHYGDIATDLYAVSYTWNEERDCYEYHTGLVVESKYNYGGWIFPRSKNRETSCYLANSVGLVDSAIYRGEIIVCFKDRTSSETRIKLAGMEAFVNSLGQNLDYEKAVQSKKQAEEEMLTRIKNLEFAPYKNLDKAVAQMVFMYNDYVIYNELAEGEELNETERGTGGFGSTDKK